MVILKFTNSLNIIFNLLISTLKLTNLTQMTFQNHFKILKFQFNFFIKVNYDSTKKISYYF